jgi:hypothetical protein
MAPRVTLFHTGTRQKWMSEIAIGNFFYIVESNVLATIFSGGQAANRQRPQLRGSVLIGKSEGQG